tara:strand:+ start:6547 stop:6705 length:159 start_codon:yes stop_codon:yes gene_type:complete
MKKRSRPKTNDGQPLWVLALTALVVIGICYLLTLPSGDIKPGNQGFFGNLDK